MYADIVNDPELERVNFLSLNFHQGDLPLIKTVVNMLEQDLVLVSTVDDALVQCEFSSFAAILINIRLPEMELSSVIEKFRQHRVSREIPLILLVNQETSVLEIVLENSLSMIDVLIRPFSAELLMAKLRLVIRLARQSAAIELQSRRLEIMEHESGYLRGELERQSAELRRAKEDMNQFSYIASHDLKEPLRMVSSYMGLLRDAYQFKLDEQAHQFIYFAVDGAMRMQYLINGIVEYNQIKRSPANIELVRPNMMVDAALMNLSAMVTESKAEITQDELPAIFADRVQLRQVFQHLLENALKFRERDNVKIHIGVEKEEKNWIFSVSDNGIGFDETQIKRVFGLFQTLHERDKYPGYGVGLAIAKKIIECNGGEIWVAAVSHQGSRLSFKWPINDYPDP